MNNPNSFMALSFVVATVAPSAVISYGPNMAISSWIAKVYPGK